MPECASVVWINGPFGVGKTTVAEEMAAAWPEALISDPELVGTMLRELLPPDLQRADYQDISLWRRLVGTAALELIAAYRRPLIVPMTLIEAGYFEEVVGGLRQSGVHVAHFTLLARPDTVRKRLADRADRGDREWALSQLTHCLPALEDKLFVEHVRTDGRDADEVAKWILEQLPPAGGSLD